MTDTKTSTENSKVTDIKTKINKKNKVQKPTKTLSGKTKMNATQRLEVLEKTMAQFINGFRMQINVIGEEIDKLSQVVTALGKRVNATIEAGENNNLNLEGVNKIILDQNIEELKGKIDFLLKEGALAKSEKNQVHEETFIVGREVDKDGNVINPRIQFALKTIDEEVKKLFIDRQLGDLIKSENENISIEITELYDIVPVKKDVDFNENTDQPS